MEFEKRNDGALALYHELPSAVTVKENAWRLPVLSESRTEHPTGTVKESAWRLPVLSESRTAGGRVIRRPFRLWRLFAISPSGKQVVVMWNRNDLVSRVKENLELKTGLPYGLQVLRKRGVEKPLVDEHLLYKSNVRDEDVIVASVCETTSFQIFVKGRTARASCCG